MGALEPFRSKTTSARESQWGRKMTLPDSSWTRPETEDLVPVAPVQRTPELDLGLSSRELHESAFPLFRARGARGVHVPASPFCCFVHRNGKLRARRQCRGWSGHVLLVPVVVPRWSEPAPLLLRVCGWGKREVAFQECASRTPPAPQPQQDQPFQRLSARGQREENC